MFTFFIGIWGCSQQITATQSVDWTLSEGWDRQPWNEDYKAQKGQTLRINTQFTIPDEYPIEGASMLLDGLWWTGTATINGTTLEPITGGIVPVELELGGYLKHGQNDFNMEIQPPTGVSSLLTGGSLSSVNPQSSSALMAAPPVLKLRPKHHIQNSTVVLDEDGIHPWAVLSSALDGYQVHFELFDEEKKILDFGTSVVNDGIATLPPQQWAYPSWGLSTPVFYTLTSTLVTEDGQSIHQHTERVAPRQVEAIASGISLNGKPTPLMGARMVYRIGGEDWTTRMQKFIGGGINALELHGEWLKEDWLNRADEMGIPLVVVPRCIGRCNMRNPGQTEGRESLHMHQDNRMVSAFLNHPSRVLYALEGPVRNIPLWTTDLLNDPHKPPVAGHHFPARILRLERKSTGFEPTCQPRNCNGAWLTETTMRLNAMNVPAFWVEVAKEYRSAIFAGSVGGIIPTPSNQQTEVWQSAWKPVAQELQIPQLSAGPFPASVDIEVHGLKPYDKIEIIRTMRHPIVFTATANGVLKARIWGSGTVRLKSGETSKEVTLGSAQWINFAHIGTPTVVQWN